MPDAWGGAFRRGAGFGFIAQRQSEVICVGSFDAAAKSLLLRKPKEKFAQRRHSRPCGGFGEQFTRLPFCMIKIRAEANRPVYMELGKILAAIPNIELLNRGKLAVCGSVRDPSGVFAIGQEVTFYPFVFFQLVFCSCLYLVRQLDLYDFLDCKKACHWLGCGCGSSGGCMSTTLMSIQGGYFAVRLLRVSELLVTVRSNSSAKF